MGVSMYPGQMHTTDTPLPYISARRLSSQVIAADFEVLYALAPARPRKPATLAMPASVPRPVLRMAGAKAASVAARPATLTSSTRRSFATSSMSSATVPIEIPALAITRSGAPKRSMKSFPAAAIALVSVMSSG